jgi:hypothetical protein
MERKLIGEYPKHALCWAAQGAQALMGRALLGRVLRELAGNYKQFVDVYGICIQLKLKRDELGSFGLAG